LVLTVDIGNTDTVLAYFSSMGDCDSTLRFSTVKGQNGASLTKELTPFFGKVFSAAIIASVVPELNNLWKEVLTESLRISSVSFVGVDIPWGFRIGVEERERIGHDRLCNMEAALRYGNTAVVVDAGTATKFDFLEEEIFQGGAIAPGLGISCNALAERSTQLFKISFDGVIPLVGKNTKEALRSGAVNVFAASVDGMIEKIFAEKKLGKSTPVIATGGYAVFLQNRTKNITHFSPNHTLEGLYAISKKI